MLLLIPLRVNLCYLEKFIQWDYMHVNGLLNAHLMNINLELCCFIVQYMGRRKRKKKKGKLVD